MDFIIFAAGMILGAVVTRLIIRACQKDAILGRIAEAREDRMHEIDAQTYCIECGKHAINFGWSYTLMCVSYMCDLHAKINN